MEPEPDELDHDGLADDEELDGAGEEDAEARPERSQKQALLLHASVRAEELAGGRGGAGAVAQARDGPPGRVARLWGGGGPAARSPRARAIVRQRWWGRTLFCVVL